MVGAYAATLRDPRGFVVAFELPIAVILAVQNGQIRMYLMEWGPDQEDCLPVRNKPAIEHEELTPRALVHARFHANIVGRANTRKCRPYLLRAQAPSAEHGVLSPSHTEAAFSLHLNARGGSGWIGLKTTRNDPRADFMSRTLPELRGLRDRDVVRTPTRAS